MWSIVTYTVTRVVVKISLYNAWLAWGHNSNSIIAVVSAEVKKFKETVEKARRDERRKELKETMEKSRRDERQKKISELARHETQADEQQEGSSANNTQVNSSGSQQTTPSSPDGQGQSTARVSAELDAPQRGRARGILRRAWQHVRRPSPTSRATDGASNDAEKGVGNGISNSGEAAVSTEA